MSEKYNLKNVKKEEDKVKLKENIIIGIINVEGDNTVKRIINSYENYKREMIKFGLRSSDFIGKENEEEIKNCEIFINEKKIQFNYYYNFPKKGNYIIKYKFKKVMT